MTYIQKLLNFKTFDQKIFNSVENIYDKVYKLTSNYKKDSAKLIKDIVQWFLKTKDISLSEISRQSFKNKKWTKKKNIVAGFSKFLKNTKLITDYMGRYIHKVTKILWKWGKTVYIAMDWWDIIKKYSKSKNLSKVHDGSTWEINNGYVLETALAFNDSLESVPLIWKLFSRKKWYKSDNKEYFSLIDFIIKHISTAFDICFIFDRWYDDKKMFEMLSKLKTYFIVCMRKNRYVKIKWKTVWIENSISYLRSLKKEVEITLKWVKKMRGKLYYWMVKMFDLNSKRKYYLVVIKNNKWQKMFLTNKKVWNAQEAMEVIKAYSYRWLIEETYKYLKQEYNLEKIHLRSEVERLNNYYNILLSSIWLAMIWLAKIWAQVKEMILKLRKEDYMWYKLKNIMYAWLEIIEYVLLTWKFFRNRHQRKWLQNQQNSLFGPI